jgi:Cd2+/Zn2+-exporting ATPase
MTDDLSKLPFAVGLGRATRKIITQNFILSLATIAILTISALSGWAGLGTTVAVHEGTTIVVALNAIRLLKFNFRE